MSKLKLILLAFVLLVIQSSILQAQVPVLGSETLLNKLRLNKGINGIESVLYADIKGDPFIFKDFMKGQLVIDTGEKIDVNVRYDTYADQMHLKDKDVIYAIIHPEKVKLIEVDSLKFIYSAYANSLAEETSKESSYFIMKTEGNCKLLIKKNIRIQDAEPAKLYVEAKPAKFIPTKDTYYLKLGDKPAIKIRNEKDLLSVLSDKKDKLSSLIKSNKLQINDINDLVKIVTNYNSF